ncbi:hypothetical protein OAY95_02960 [Candidatus Pelagibacter sp.]|nr:hypothetical protein [Candidatus Pelagibacter sp.]
MKSKSFIQLILFLIVILSSFIVYQYFFSENKSVKIIDSQPNEIQPQNSQSIQSKIIDTDNIIEKLEYKSIDAYGNEYVIKSSKAESQMNNSNDVKLFKVSAIIYSPKKKPIMIKSDFALHNKLTFNTKFYNNVEILHDTIQVSSDNLDLLYKENRVDLYNIKSANYKQSTILADKITFDILTKNVSVNMYKDDQRIKILYK